MGTVAVSVTEAERGPRRLAPFLLRKSHVGTLLQITVQRNSSILAHSSLGSSGAVPKGGTKLVEISASSYGSLISVGSV